MGSNSSKKPPPGSVQILVTLKPETDELRAYNRIMRKLQDEINKRQKGLSDDVPCVKPPNNCALVRGALFALDNVRQEELPDYFDLAWKPKGRKAIGDTSGETDSDSGLEDRPTLLH